MHSGYLGLLKYFLCVLNSQLSQHLLRLICLSKVESALSGRCTTSYSKTVKNEA